ncbi:MAG: hypothetical protein RBT63_10170 [Bdellovibrionales bacterium]|jgi:hypothetical protein|nr:hypothetical protein [Bdellovibrionales bacterium]
MRLISIIFITMLGLPSTSFGESAGRYSDSQFMKPPAGWFETPAVTPNIAIWLKSPVPGKIERLTQGSQVAIQKHSGKDKRIQTLRGDLGKYDALKLGGLDCIEVRLDGKPPRAQPTRQTWCFDEKGDALTIVERGTDRIDFKLRNQIIEKLRSPKP